MALGGITLIAEHESERELASRLIDLLLAGLVLTWISPAATRISPRERTLLALTIGTSAPKAPTCFDAMFHYCDCGSDSVVRSGTVAWRSSL